MNELFGFLSRYANAVHAVEIQDIERIGVLNTLNENLENTIQVVVVEDWTFDTWRENKG